MFVSCECQSLYYKLVANSRDVWEYMIILRCDIIYNCSLNFIVDNFFSLKIKQFIKVISISLFLQIYNFINFGIFEWYYSFLSGSYFSNYYYAALDFLISFGRNKIFKF